MTNPVTQVSHKKPTTTNPPFLAPAGGAQAKPNNSMGANHQNKIGGSAFASSYSLAGKDTANKYFYGQQTIPFNGERLTVGAYATTPLHGYWPNNNNNHNNGLGGYYTAPQQATSNMYATTTPTKGTKSSANSQPSPKPPLSSSKSNETSVFDENTELKERIKELEAKLGMQTKPITPKKAFGQSCQTVNVKPDKSPLSASITPVKDVKKDPDTPLKIDTPIKDLNKHDRKWIARYEELGTYQKTHGHTMVPAAFKPLGPWVSRQRQEKKKGILSEERMAMLDDMDFVWVAK
jgi:hypothetical protein